MGRMKAKVRCKNVKGTGMVKSKWAILLMLPAVLHAGRYLSWGSSND